MSHPFRKRLFKKLFLVIILTVTICSIGCSSQRASSIKNSSKQRVSAIKIHTVTQGETLFSIAWRYGMDYKKIAIFNGINAPYTIYPAQKIQLNGVSGVVKPTVQSGSAALPLSATAKQQKVASQRAISLNNRSINKAKGITSIGSGATAQGALLWQWPVTGKVIASFEGETSLNKGIDLGGKLGEPVIAAAAGQVVYSGSGLRGYGKLLIIKHNEIFLSAYAHNNDLLVNEGDFVKAGQAIADMGSSGTDKVKLHFEIRSEGNPVDPLKYLPKRY